MTSLNLPKDCNNITYNNIPHDILGSASTCTAHGSIDSVGHHAAMLCGPHLDAEMSRHVLHACVSELCHVEFVCDEHDGPALVATLEGHLLGVHVP